VVSPPLGRASALSAAHAAACEAGGVGAGVCTAVVVRTLPNDPAKASRAWSGTVPPYLTLDAAQWLAAHGVQHLVVDLPSVDREDDGGLLVAHRCIWGVALEGQPPEGAALPPHSITELAYVPDRVPDGVFCLSLQVAPLALDAAPSRPVLYPLAPPLSG
jgi:arylformamidase